MRRLSSALWVLLLITGVHHLAHAQEFATAERGPRFMLASGEGKAPVQVEARSVALLGRRVSVHFESTAIEDALNEISASAGVRVFYNKELLPSDLRVSLKAQDITVAAALTEVLFNADVDVVISGRQVALVKRIPMVAVEQWGTVVGTVTDASNGRPLPSAQVWIETTRQNTLTDGEGRYRLTNVEPGPQKITASLIGYRRAMNDVDVIANETVTTGFRLDVSPTTLTELVVTATGEQPRLELGHVVGRIKADSIMKHAPVSSVSELLTARVAGLQVQTASGAVGGEVRIQVRSPNTIALTRDPIIIVDGVRYTSLSSQPRTILSTINFVEPTSPLNDLNPNEIESIEVVKGPSAATLYGTDASNGVIVVTTKRGTLGAARWRAYGKGAITQVATSEFPDQYWGWSNSAANNLNCDLNSVASGACSQDSMTVFTNPLNDSERTIFAARPRWEWGTSVSGGSRDLRYFVAADLEQATGPLRMPAALLDSLEEVRGLDALPDEQENPNAFSKINLRSNTTIGLGTTSELHLNVGYARRNTRTFGMNFLNPYATSIQMFRPGEPYLRGGPAEYFSRTSTERVSRFFSSAVVNWGLYSWLSARATAGVDLTSSTRASLAQRGEAIRIGFGNGAVGDDRGRQLVTTGDLAATASFSRGSVRSRTSIGAQYVRAVNDLLINAGLDLPPGGSSIGEAASVQADQTYREQVTLGTYIEEMLGINQRLFLTGALRADGASTFGNNYDVAIYPKAGVSWLLSEEPLIPKLPYVDELRLRYAFGASGQQPLPEWSRPTYDVRQVFVDAQVANAYRVSTLGNPNLRPERVREHEFGFDGSIFRNRIDLNLTWFRRSTVDQIVTIEQEPGLGSIRANLGRTTGSGFEAQVRAQIVDSRDVSWNLTLLHSFHRTVLEDLGGATERKQAHGGWVEGYPIGARFMRSLTGFSDANGDGIIASSELQFSDSVIYMGESTPPRSLIVSSGLSVLGGRLRIAALAERRSGFTQVNAIGRDRCSYRVCRGAVDRTASLADQAVAVATYTTGAFTWIEPGDFTRLREVSISVDLPRVIVASMRLNSATLTLQGRNLALWTSYGGADPESASINGISAMEIGIPQGRSWGMRIDVGF